MSTVVTIPAAGPLDSAWQSMTFPSYRPLLAVVGSVNAATGGRPVARLAVDGDTKPLGLALAEIGADGTTAELLSLFVTADARRRGVGTALVEALEGDLRAAGVGRVEGVYMTGRPSIEALERIFARCGFDPPVLRKIVVRFTPEEAATTEWWRRARLPEGSEVFSWIDLKPEELEEIRRTQAESPWIDPDLEPWRCSDRFDPVSSVGLRRHGKVVGWVINHPIGPDVLCFTTSFVRRDLARRGAIFPLYRASIERLMGSGVTCTFVTSSQFESMMRFVLRRCAPFISFCGETRGVSKTLGSVPTSSA